MPFPTLFSFWVATLIASLIAAQNTPAQPAEVPPDVFEAKPDGYLYAGYPGVFDNLRRVDHDGITVEAWIYLTGMPEDANYQDDNYRGSGQWVIFAKPGSYYTVIRGRDLGSVWGRRDPEGLSSIIFATAPQPTPNNATGGFNGSFIEHEDYPLNRWVHIARQIWEPREERDNVRSANYYDSIFESIGGQIGDLMGRTPAPFVIGGTPIVSFKVGAQWGATYASMQGYVDAVRVSKGFRYDIQHAGQKINPPRHFKPDAQTIALWQFKEGPGAPFYRDSSRNDYTLFPGGSLAVQPHGKVAATWGEIKTRKQF